MKFQTLGVTDNIFAPGYFRDLMSEIDAGTAVKDFTRLTPDQLATIPSIYANIDPSTDIMELKPDQVIMTGNNKPILGADFKAITLIMYTKPRSTYCKFKEVQVRARGLNGGVPLGLLGFKRHQNIRYDSWRKTALDEIKYEDKDNVMGFKFTDDALRKIFKIDLLLGKTFASTYYDPSDDTIKLHEKKDWGLILASAFNTVIWEPKVGDVRYLRDNNVSGKGVFSTAYGAKQVPVLKNDKLNLNYLRLHNKCNTPMKLLLSQRWCWYGMHRSTDMICDHRDWDNQPKQIDNMAAGWDGVEPKQASSELAGLKTMFGI
jgi:hypothetical protein